MNSRKFVICSGRQPEYIVAARLADFPVRSTPAVWGISNMKENYLISQIIRTERYHYAPAICDY